MTKPVNFGDCEWYAIDSIGQLGYFTTGGSEFFPDYYRFDPSRLFDAAEMAQKLLPCSGHHFVAKKRPGYRYDDWSSASDKGLFAYDYDLYQNSGYKLITTPTSPLSGVEELLSWARRIPKYHGVFGQTKFDAADVIRWPAS